ncbi:MAG: BREX-6 system adenine-specific DNA-methyltransferase PglX, partial [Cyanobacteria bacterium CAN_BIN43]|nr:BREX-6 system adenine-specific DNA-methyltransferase PglX [Cyanobacteria bacterium CAN_BIN43]
MSQLTPEVKNKLSSTIRSLRDRLLTDLHNATESMYRLSIKSLEKAGLAEEQYRKRQRLEQWLDEQVRSEAGKKGDRAALRERYLRSAQTLAAATMLNRLVVIKQMEAQGLMKPAVGTGGWQRAGYREFREFAPDLCKDETEGYGALLQWVYDELALELPGLFGRVGLTELFPVTTGTLRAVVEALNAPGLAAAWLDDTTLGWVYQYWNDPEREALDAKMNGGGKVEPHEIASKTQMFTERYMVEWLLQNSLGQMWLGICQRNGWVAEVEADGTLARLEERRQEWRSQREKGEVTLDALMPIAAGIEERWKYWVLQPLTDEGTGSLSIRDIKILDPACGSGHFLVIAFDLLFALYQEEARHRGEEWSEEWIAVSILENNLHGVDIDPRAVQIAAAALVLKARRHGASLKVVNLVASNLQLASLPEDDLALVELKREVRETTGIPEELTQQIVQALKGADQWGSLLKIDGAVEGAIATYEKGLIEPLQISLPFISAAEVVPVVATLADSAMRKDLLLKKLERFLERCTKGDDLGLRLRGEQLAAGVRFIRLIREGAYDLVVGNPPYLGASKMADAKFLAVQYPKGKADLYAVFLERGLQLVKPGGMSALLTMRNWMFIQQFSGIREHLLETFDLCLLGDVDRGAFEETMDEVVATTMSIFRNAPPNEEKSIAIQPTPLNDNARDSQRTKRKRAAVLAQVGRFEFRSDRFRAIKEQPLIYWWDDKFLERYSVTEK